MSHALAIFYDNATRVQYSVAVILEWLCASGQYVTVKGHELVDLQPRGCAPFAYLEGTSNLELMVIIFTRTSQLQRPVRV